jgi:hypothetical protein
MNSVNYVNRNSRSLFNVTQYLVSFYAVEAVNNVERHNLYGNVQETCRAI